MDELINDIIGKLKTPAVLNTHFSRLLDSLSGIRKLSHMGNQQHHSEDELIDVMLKACIEHIEAEELALYIKENNNLVCVAHLNWEQFIANAPSINTLHQSFAMDEGFIGKTARNKELMYIRDCRKEHENDINNVTNGTHKGSVICAPLLTNDTLIVSSDLFSSISKIPIDPRSS